MEPESLKSRSHISDLIISNRIAWMILVVSIVIQLLSVRQHFLRDIEGLYTYSTDQGVYLADAYGAFERIRTEGLGKGLGQIWFAGGQGTGVLVQGEAALAYLFLGASRTSSLLVIFAHFAILQIAIFALFRRITSRNSIGFLCVGLLLLTQSRYFWAGGLDDFRLDLAAAAWYGVALCLLLGSNVFVDRRWSVLFALACAALFSTRFISITFTLLAIGSILFLLMIMPATRSRALGYQRRILNGLIVVAVAIAAFLPFVYNNARTLFEYYFVGHLISPERSIRAAEVGVTNKFDGFFYYFRSLAYDHLGNLVLGMVILCATVYLALSFLGRQNKNDEIQDSPLPNPGLLMFVVLCWILWPLALFTIDQSKSPIVAGMLVAPVIIAVGLGFQYLSAKLMAASVDWRAMPIPAYLGVTVLLAGTVFSVSKQATLLPSLKTAREAKDLYEAYDAISADIRQNHLTSPKFATDRQIDYFHGVTAKTVIYERSGQLVETRELLATGLLEVSKEAALKVIDDADYALVTISQPSVEKNTLFPFHKSMIRFKKDLSDRANLTMIPLKRVVMGDHEFMIYSRPHITVSGTSAGWLQNTGASVKIPSAALRRWGHVVLSGPTILAEYLNGGLRCTPWIGATDGKKIPLKVSSYMGGNQYAIAIQVLPFQVSDSEITEINLDFPTYFVPRENRINADERKLVVSAPTEVRLSPGEHAYPKVLQPSVPVPKLAMPTVAAGRR